MAKLDIDFVLLDESVVMNGFRSLMTGARLDDFKRNPVMLYMHNRNTEYNNPNQDSIPVLGRWYDIRIEGDQLIAKPDFDDDDEFAQRIQKKVDKGYLNGASVWIDPITVSDDDQLALPGQIGPTLTEWGVFEASIVDIPNCKNALAIRNDNGELLQLSSANRSKKKEVNDYLSTLISKNKKHMETKFLAVKLGLQEEAKEEHILAKLNAVLADNKKVEDLKGEVAELKTKLTKSEEDVKKIQIDTLIDQAVKDKKIGAGDKDMYVKLAQADFDTTKGLLDKMKAYEPIAGKVGAGSKDGEADRLAKLSFDEIDQGVGLGVLRKYPDLYKQKFEEKFGKEP